jgi:hypothetical protein
MIIGIASADYLRADRSLDGVEQWGGAGWARLGQYVEPLRAHGYTVICGTMWQDTHGISVADAEETRVYPDVVILQRLMHEGIADAIKWGRSKGQIVINDVDDWFWGLSPSNDAFLGSHPKYNLEENTSFYGPNLAASDMLTVSTPYLAERMSRKVRSPIVVIPNYIDVSRFTPVIQSSWIPNFGWAGSTGHRSGDIETVAGVLRPAILNTSIFFHHAGHFDGSPAMSDLLGVGKDDITTAERTNAAEYPSLLSFDVGIVPLRDTPFNHAKSDIKGLEYAASGIPFIAQDMPSYKALHKAWDGAFHLARRPKDWISGIKRYQPLSKRLEDQALVLDRVKSRDIQFGAIQWIELLEGLVT